MSATIHRSTIPPTPVELEKLETVRTTNIHAGGAGAWRRPVANPLNDAAASADVLVCQVVGRPQHNQRSLKMMNMSGWMNGGMGGGMWIWTVILVLVVVLLIIAINKMSKK